MRRLVSIVSIGFVLVCIVTLVGHIFDIAGVLSYLENLYSYFDYKGSLKITSLPADALIYLNNAYVGKTPRVEKVSEGEYDVKVTLKGYRTYAKKVQVSKKEITSVDAELSEQRGRLEIKTNPFKAIVYLDGIKLNQVTPLVIEKPPGEYELKIIKDQYYVDQRSIIIRDDTTEEVEVDLVPQIGKLAIASEPSEAKVYINDKYIGITPLTHDKPVGKYHLVLKKEGFRDHVGEAILVADETLEINVQLKERTGTLEVITNPPGTEVHINDVYYGETPLKKDLKPGSYELILKKSKHRILTETVVMEDLVTKKIQRELTPEIGEVRIDSEPSSAKVFLDGEDIGYTPISLNKPPGLYKLRVIKPGYKHFVTDIQVGDAKSTHIEAPLEKDKSSDTIN
jgi:hypothetical protein